MQTSHTHFLQIFCNFLFSFDKAIHTTQPMTSFQNYSSLHGQLEYLCVLLLSFMGEITVTWTLEWQVISLSESSRITKRKSTD